VERVGSFAFDNCKKFSGFLSANLREIGESVFRGCSSLTSATVFGTYQAPVLFGKTAPEDTAPYYTVTLGADTYYVPKALYSVLIVPTSAGEVLTDVLYDCYTVKSVQFAGNVQSISSYAFRLEHYTPSAMPFNVTLPSNLITIGSNAFLTRNDLTAIELPAMLEEIGERAFYGITSLRSVTIEAHSLLASVGRDAFTSTPWYNTYTGVIALGKVVLGISEEYCRKATYYEISSDKFRSYSVIAPYAFAGNTVLQKITLSDSISQIGDNAFAGCTALRTFAFKQYVSTSSRKLGITVLDGCSSLYDLTVCEDIDIDLLFASGAPASLRTLRIDNSSRSDAIVATNEDGFSASSLTATNVSSLYIGAGFAEIGEGAFQNVTTLTYLSVAEDVSTIAASAFAGCNALEDATGLAGLSVVGDNAFDGCSALAAFDFPSGLTEIGDNAFRGCAFASFAAPAALSSIGESAFDGCALLKEVTLSSGVVSIGDRAFRGCDLSSLDIPDSVVFLAEENEFVGEEMLADNNYFKSLTLSSGVTVARLFGSTVPTTFVRVAVKNCALADEQFKDLSTIMTATLQNVTAIGDKAFYGCNLLQHIVVPSTVTSIGESAFEGCSSLNSCQIDTAGTVLTVIKQKAFKGCSALKYVVFPETLTSGDWTELFYGCAALTTTNVPTAIKEIGESAYYGCERLVTLRMHNEVEVIGAYAFKNCYLTELDNVSFEKLSYLGDGAFENCGKLGNIRAENAEFIGENVYKNCTSLTELTVGENPVSYYAGSEILSGLTVIDVASYVGQIDVDTYLTGCDSVSSVVVYTTSSSFPARSFAEKVNALTNNKAITFLSVPLYASLSPSVANVYSKPSQMDFRYAYNEQNLTASIIGVTGAVESYVYLPDSVIKDEKEYAVTSIGGSAFVNSRFTYVVIPSSIVEIGNAAFAKSTLETVVFESGSKCVTIGENAFKESALTAISVPSSVEEIGGSAFDNCTALTRVTFFAGSNLNFIGDNAFNMTTSLTSMTFTGPISYVGSSAFSGSSVNYVDFGSLASFDAVNNYTFASSQIATVILPDTVLRIEEGAFSGFAGESFVCPADLSYIGTKAFYKANALKSFVFSDRLTEIGSEAFFGNTELTAIALPDSVEKVGDSAFNGCEKATELTLDLGLESVGMSAFDGLLSLTGINYNARRLNDFALNNGVFASCGISGTGIRVVFGEQVVSLPDNLFYASTAGDKTPRIADVSFSGTPSVENIGSNAFRGGSNLGSIVLPATVLSIGSGAFVGCESVTLYSESAKAGLDWATGYKDNDKNVVFGKNNVTVNNYSFVAYDDGVVVTNYTGERDVVVPNRLGGRPVLGTGVTFEGSDVTFIVLPDSIVLPGSFNGCSSLVGITMEEGPLAIAKKAFYGCSSLLYFDLPSSVVTIGQNAFTGCDALGTVYVSGAEIAEKLTAERLSDTCGGLFASAKSVYIASSLNVVLPAYLQVSGSATRTYNKVLSDKDGYAVWSTLYWRSSSAVSASYVYLLNDWTPDSDHDDIEPRYNLYVEGIGAMKEYSSSELIPWKDYSDIVNSVTIGRNITSLGQYSFSRMKNLSAVYFLAEECAGSTTPKNIFNAEQNTSGDGFTLFVGSNVTTIPSYLFYGNRYLTSVVWDSNKVKTIETSAFENCTGLAVVNVPNCVVSVGARAFFGCSKVTSLTIGQGVKSFGSAAFGNFGADENGFYLTAIYYNALSATNELSDVFTSSYKLGAGDVGTELVVNRAVTSIPDYLFSGFDRLIQVTFNGESSVRTIGKYAFESCVNLRSINIPLAVTSVGQYAFSGCSQLSAIGFADNNRIAFIGEKAFDDTDYFNTASNWTDDVLYLNDRKFLLEARLSVSEDYAILEGTDIIAEKAFAGIAGIRYISVPSSIDIICANAFDGCTGLKTVFLVSTPVISGLSAQESQGALCKYATVVYCRSDLMKNGRTKAGDYLADGFALAETDTMKGTNQYYSYTKLYWQCAKPETTSNVYAYLLNDFTRSGYYRMEVAGVGEMCDFTARSAPWYSFESTDYSGLVTTVTFGKGVASVGSYAFRSFSELNKINYNNSDGLLSIGEAAFAVCSSLTEIEICKTVTSIGDYAFSACGAVTKIVYKAVSCADFAENNGVFTGVGTESDSLILEIDNEVTRIPAYLCCPATSASNAPKLTEIKFYGGAGNHCEFIGEYAFAYCEQVVTLTMDGNSLLSIGEYAFYSCKSIAALSIPSKVEDIAYNAFGMCVGITQITLRAANCRVSENGVFHFVGSETDGTIVSFTDTVRTVPERFLYNAADLHNGPKVVSVYFPEDDQSRLENIGSLAFGYCSLIKTITLPKTLNSI
ncbi:MAG: leucine-rich repeat protein, partial [Clostridia bacterium]|nr:leucine-rich repeat protein [Clostridia bacterium]